MLLQDWSANKGNIKGRLVLLLFRLSQSIRRWPGAFFYIGIPYLIFYRIFVEWILGIELPWNLRVGSGVRIFHGMGLVINDQVEIGDNVILRHCTTIGVGRTTSFGCPEVPRIGNNVDIGSIVVIIGNITIGDGVIIGPGSVVV